MERKTSPVPWLRFAKGCGKKRLAENIVSAPKLQSLPPTDESFLLIASPLPSLYLDTRIWIQSTTAGPPWTWLDTGYSKQNMGTSDVAKWCSTCTRLSWSWLSVRVRTVDLLGVLVLHLGFLALSSANVKAAMTALMVVIHLCKCLHQTMRNPINSRNRQFCVRQILDWMY